MKVKIVRVSRQFVPGLFNRPSNVLIEGLPEDAELVDIATDFYFNRDEIAFKFRSESFEEVEPGHVIPDLMLTITEQEEPEPE